MEDEVLLCEFAVGTIHDYHVLFSIGDGTLVADVRASQSVVSSYHDTVYLSLLELPYRIGCLLLQRVLEDLKTVEG